MKSLYRAADAHPIKTQERWRRDILRALELEVKAAFFARRGAQASQRCASLINCPGGLVFHPVANLGRILDLAQIF